MRGATLSPAWAGAAFLLALFGFGAKAGLVPLHVWLPEAHPAAPSPVSAMMSGLMLKVAIYGLLRISFDLLHAGPWWWGMLTLALGLGTALFGAVFAAVQTDMKRLLAYSSIENIGLIFAGHRPGAAVLRIRHAPARRAGAHRGAAARAQPRAVQEPAVSGHRIGAARHPRAQPGQARRPDPQDAVGRHAGPDRHAGPRRPAATERFRFRVAAAAGLPVDAADPACVPRT